MSKINIRQFESVSALNTAVAALLKHHIELDYPGTHAVMLSGGKTPFAAYRLLSGKSCVPSRKLRLFLSDERLVPETSCESNFGNMRFMFNDLGLNEKQLIRVNSALNPGDAAARYNLDLQSLVNKGGNISLGLLGLGPDGHTASLFSCKDLERAKGTYAVSVTAPDGMNRVSVTPRLISKIRQVVFVVSGEGKKAIVDKLISNPFGVIAGLAVAGVSMKDLWFAA
jgi:6-phosphogluconolactonase/glucosamine-6-phosphate isomerase/deaminase